MTPAAKLRAKLLDLAIRGKLVPQDPADEPAEKLLKRIVAAKSCLSRKRPACRASVPGVPVAPDVPAVPPEEQPFPLPKGWTWCRLGEILQSMGTKRPQGDTFLYIDIDAIDNKKNVVLKPKCLPVAKAPSRASRGLKSGDTLFSLVRPYLRNIAYVDDSLADCIASTGFYVCRPQEVNPRFLFLMLRSVYVVNGLNAFMKGDNSPSIRGEQLERFPFPLPPLAEQKRIVAKLETLLKAVDTLGTCAEKFDKLGDKARAKILDLAIRGKLVPQDPADEPAKKLLKRILAAKSCLSQRRTACRASVPGVSVVPDVPAVPPEEQPFPLPKGWVWCRLGEICSKIGAGSTPLGGKRVYVDKGIKFIREQNVHNSGLCNEGMVFIDGNTNRKMAGTIVKPCDLLMNITGASIGRTALVADDFDIGNVNQHVLIIRLVDLNIRHFVHLVLCSPHIVQRMLNVQTGDKPGLSAEKVKNFLVPLPPLAEQKRIVAKVEALLAACEKLKGAGA